MLRPDTLHDDDQLVELVPRIRDRWPRGRPFASRGPDSRRMTRLTGTVRVGRLRLERAGIDRLPLAALLFPPVPPTSRPPSIPDPKPPIDVKVAARLLAEGHTYAEIGARLGYRPSSIRRCLLQHGVRPRRKRVCRNEKWGEVLYGVWKSMRRRCAEQGTQVSDGWQSFDAFYDWARSAGYRPRLALGRKDERKAFSAKNCEWRGRRPARPKKARKPMKTLSEPEWRRAEKLYVEDHVSCPAIARRLGVSYGTILRGLKLRGCYVPPPSGRTGTATGRRLYQKWYGLRSRCYDPGDPVYLYYGAKGATVCREWEEFAAFHDWAVATGWKPGLCLTRRRGQMFSPTNCFWTSRAEAARGAHHPSSKIPPRLDDDGVRRDQGTDRMVTRSTLRGHPRGTPEQTPEGMGSRGRDRHTPADRCRPTTTALPHCLRHDEVRHRVGERPPVQSDARDAPSSYR